MGPQEESGGDNGDDEYLDGFENVDEGVSLDEEPFLVEVGFEELGFGDCVLFEDEGCFVASGSVVRDGELVLEAEAGVEALEFSGELGDGDVSVGLASVRPVLLLVFS